MQLLSENIRFGTDGIRGVFGKNLTDVVSFSIGNALSRLTCGRVAVARDTRPHGVVLLQSLVDGLTSGGTDVVDFGIVPTAALSHLTCANKCSYGVMLTASHNPPEYNGIKIVDKRGDKLCRELELLIEHIALVEPCEFTYVGAYRTENAHAYTTLLGEQCYDLKGMRIVLDCANGATSPFAYNAFADAGAKVFCFNDSLNGRNINLDCGALCPRRMADKVVYLGADLGLCFDGDGDRVIAVDEHGNVVDGDSILFVLSRYYKALGKLASNTIVGTVTTNYGTEKALRSSDIQLIRTDVGDSNVAAEMFKNGYVLGGESSGHIILSHILRTGDGITAGLELAAAVKNQCSKLSQVAKHDKTPTVGFDYNTDDAATILERLNSDGAIDRARATLGDGGRILVRKSGTEAKLRVLAEADDYALAQQACNELRGEIDKMTEGSPY